MAKKLGQALEELQIERVLREKATADAGNEFDHLYQNARQEIKIKEEARRDAAEDSEESSESGGEDEEISPKDDTEKDATAAEGSESKEADTDIDGIEDAGTALECFLNLHKEALSNNVAVEDLFTKVNLAYLGEKTLAGLGHLKDFGFKYGAVSLKHVYKGVVTSLNKTVQAITRGTLAIKKYIDKRINSLNNIKNRIETARKALELLDDQADRVVTVKELSQIKKLISGNNMEIESNLKKALKFQRAFFQHLDINVRNSTEASAQLVKNVIEGKVSSPNAVMRETFGFDGFIRKAIEGYKPDSQYLDAFVYRDLLPGNVLFAGYLPIENLDSHEAILEAYSGSKLFFGFSRSETKLVEEYELPTISELKAILDTAEQICDFGIQLEALFLKVIAERETLKKTLSPYVKFLLLAKNKVSIRDSMVEYVSYKIKFLDNTSIAGAMYVNDYIVQLLLATLSVVKTGVKEYS